MYTAPTTNQLPSRDPASLGFFLPSITHLTILTSGNQVSSMGAAGISICIIPWPWRRAAGCERQGVGGRQAPSGGTINTCCCCWISVTRKPCSAPEGTSRARRPSGMAPFPILGNLRRNYSWLIRWCSSQPTSLQSPVKLSCDLGPWHWWGLSST